MTGAPAAEEPRAAESTRGHPRWSVPGRPHMDLTTPRRAAALALRYSAEAPNPDLGPWIVNAEDLGSLALAAQPDIAFPAALPGPTSTRWH
jgi:hypothetical protein